MFGTLLLVCALLVLAKRAAGFVHAGRSRMLCAALSMAPKVPDPAPQHTDGAGKATAPPPRYARNIDQEYERHKVRLCCIISYCF